jgi:hypothetical protein
MENDRTAIAKNLIRAILKSKKMLQIYPANNAICRAAVDEVYSIASGYLNAYGNITLLVRPNGLFIDSEEVYHSDEKTDNIAMYFFREGIREISIREGLEKFELEEFLKLIGIDFSKDDTKDDFLMVMWEKDLEGIKVVVDELFLIENQEETDGQETGAGHLVDSQGGEYASEEGTGESPEEKAYEITAEDDRLMKAYREGLFKEDIVAYTGGDTVAEERAFVMAELHKGTAEQLRKMADILIYIFLHERNENDYAKIAGYIEEVIAYSVRGGSISTMLSIVKNLKGLERQPGINPRLIGFVRKILLFCVSAKTLEQMGNMLDNSKDITEEDLIEYSWYFGSDAIKPLITLLESLQSMHARRMVNDVLIHIGKENMDAIIERLSDPVWYVVRNVIYVLRGIGDAKAQDSILGVIRHDHPRVRLEALKSIQDFKSVKALQAIKELFDDMDSLVRLTAVAVMGNLAKENPGVITFARDAIFSKINEKEFAERDFREKKAFYEALVYAGDSDIETHMLGLLKKKSLFGGKKQLEARACAAHYLGLARCREALPALEELMKSSDLLLMEHAAAAVHRIRE